MVYVVGVALVVVLFYRFAGRFDWVTAYFAGMPGGLTEIIEIGEASGAKPAPIILAHSLRIVVTIALIAFWFRIVEAHARGAGLLQAAPRSPHPAAPDAGICAPLHVDRLPVGPCGAVSRCARSLIR
jgi:uncharacterized membrane protein AbrB (regulator of aidB expression)